MTRPRFATSGGDVAALIADPTTGVLSLPESSAGLVVWDSFEGGSQVTDLALDEAGSSTITLAPGSTRTNPQGVFYGPDGYEGPVYLEDANGTRWRVDPDNWTELLAEPGAAGVGVPTGGTSGQVLAKASGTNYDTTWVPQSVGGASSWSDLSGKPAFIGAGSSAALARAAIEAASTADVTTLTSDLGSLTTDVDAKADATALSLKADLDDLAEVYRVRTAVDITGAASSTTFQTATALNLTLDANEEWDFTYELLVTGSGTADLNLQWVSTSTGTTMAATISGPAAGAASLTAARGNQAILAVSTPIAEVVGLINNTTPAPVLISGWVKAGTTGGTFSLQHAQGTSNAQVHKILAGSRLIAVRVGA